MKRLLAHKSVVASLRWPVHDGRFILTEREVHTSDVENSKKDAGFGAVAG
jgi:hypothetical protein